MAHFAVWSPSENERENILSQHKELYNGYQTLNPAAMEKIQPLYTQDFADRDAVLLTGSTDNEFCKLAWQRSHEDLSKIKHIQFADTQREQPHTYENLSLVEQLGVFFNPAGAALRATFIVDPDNVIQHVTVNNLNVGRSPEETLRVLDALQTGELCACNRTVGGETL